MLCVIDLGPISLGARRIYFAWGLEVQLGQGLARLIGLFLPARIFRHVPRPQKGENTFLLFLANFGHISQVCEVLWGQERDFQLQEIICSKSLVHGLTGLDGMTSTAGGTFAMEII